MTIRVRPNDPPGYCRVPVRIGECVRLPVVPWEGRPLVAFHPLLAHQPPGEAMYVAVVHSAGLAVASAMRCAAGDPPEILPAVCYYTVGAFEAGKLCVAGMPRGRSPLFFGRVLEGGWEATELILERIAADDYRRQARMVCPHQRVDPRQPRPRPAQAVVPVAAPRVKAPRPSRVVDFSGCADADLLAEVIARGLLEIRGGGRAW